jgi:hypothetical protein
MNNEPSSSRNPKDLLDRYLQAVGFWLPKAQQQDIIAELSEDLHSQIEDKEAALGRSLNETEIDDILKQRGRPVLVANRYLPQRSLIGPVLFPIYLFVVKIVAAFYLVPWVLVWIGMMSFSSSYRAQHTSGGWLDAIGAGWSAWWLNAFFALGTVTLVFVILEQVQARSRFLEDWNPRKLPPVRNPNQIPRSGSLIEVAANLGFGIWWVNIMIMSDIMSTRVILDRPEIRIVLSPVWRYFFWGFLLLAVINTAVAGVNLARPYWTVLRASFRLATNGAASALFCWMMKASVLAEISGAHISAARALEVTNAINLGMGKVFPVVLATGVVIALVDVRRILRARNAVPVQLKGAVSTAVV